MKAAYYDRYGPPDVLSVREVPTPDPGAGDVLIRVHASTATTGDVRVRGWDIPTPLFWLPGRLALGLTRPRARTPGFELAGVIERVGEAVTRYGVGDEVIASTGLRFGGNAEYICLPEQAAMVRKPAGVSFADASTLPFAAKTALFFLRDQGGMKAGQRVLVNGASGAIGTYAVQLCRHFGAAVVGVCSGKNAELVESLGAERVIDYTTTEVTDDADTYDIIFDTLGVLRFGECRRLLTPEGRFCAAVQDGRAMLGAVTTGVFGNQKLRGGTTPSRREDLELLAGLLESGEIRAVIDRTYALAEIVEAHRYVETGRKRGSVVIDCSRV